MLNIKKICRAVLMAAFMCSFFPASKAEAASTAASSPAAGFVGKQKIKVSASVTKEQSVYSDGNGNLVVKSGGRWYSVHSGADGNAVMGSAVGIMKSVKFDELERNHQEQTEAEWRSTPEGALIKNSATGANVTASDSKKVNNAPANGVMLTGATKEKCEESCQAPAKCVYNNGGYTCASSDADAPDKGIGTNTTQSASTVTGCSSNYGLFSGLIDTGRRIFKGLRDLIYVVAGFGIIGVAVGGFFGNLNWKWLGAIVIALVVIATTGEIINMITGCENFTKAMIEDTLK